MAKKIKLTRPALKRQRDALARFERFLPTLKLKQQQLQVTLRDVAEQRLSAERELAAARDAFEPYRAVLADRAGVDIQSLAKPAETRTSVRNVAGVNVPVFEGVTFPRADYSLFATPVWVDRALVDLRKINSHAAALEVLQKQFDLLTRELTRITQRVNLFEKVMIPDAREAIRRIRIWLGEQMTAGVVRAKIAKGKLSETQTTYHETTMNPSGVQAP